MLKEDWMRLVEGFKEVFFHEFVGCMLGVCAWLAIAMVCTFVVIKICDKYGINF